MKNTIRLRILAAAVATTLLVVCLSLGMAQQATDEFDYEQLPSQVKVLSAYEEALAPQVQGVAKVLSAYEEALAPQVQGGNKRLFDFAGPGRLNLVGTDGTEELLGKYVASKDEEERAKIAAELTNTVAEEFDARQAARASELKQMGEQLQRLRSLHELRTQKKDDIVRDRVRQLISHSTGLGWGTDNVGDTVDPYGRSSDWPRTQAGQ